MEMKYARYSREFLGIDLYFYGFKTEKEMHKKIEKLKNKGVIEIVYLDSSCNGVYKYGFQFKKNRVIKL